MDKKFFDNTIIAQYAVTGVPLKVYVDSRYLTITDADDVENPLIGQGMEPNGEMEPFSYQDIDHLLVADNIIDLETYNTAMADQFKSDEPEEAPEGDEEAPEEEGEEGGDDIPDEEVPEEEPAEEEPTTEEGFDPTGIDLAEISKDVLKAKMDVIKQQEKELKDKEAALKKEPIDELTLGGPSGETMLQDLHRETDPAKQKKMKIKLGREKYGAYSDRSALEDADYALKKFRQQMRGYTGDPIGVYDPSKDTYKAKAKAPKVRWTQKKYDRWIDDVSSNEGWRNAYDMAQNANNEPGLIDWVKKNVVFNDETPLERIQYDIEAMAESWIGTYPYKSIIDKWTPPNLVDFAKELRSMDDATRKGFEEHVAEMTDVTRDSEWMGMIKVIEAIKRKYNMKESKKIREAKGRPYGLSKEEASDLPKGPSKAGVKRLIKDVEEMLDTEIDANGDPLTNETEMILQKELKRLKALLRESVNERLTNKRNIVKQTSSRNSYAVIDDKGKEIDSGLTLDDAKEVIKQLNSKTNESVNEAANKLDKELLKHINGMGISKSDKGRMKSYLQKADIDPRADIKDLITHTKEILDIKESVHEGIDGLKAGDKVQNQYDGVIATIKSIDGNSVTVIYDDMKSLRNEFGAEAKEFYNQSEKLPMAKFKKAWDRKEYISYGSIKKLGPWANLDEAPNTAYRVVGDSPTSKESNHPETVYANSEKEAIEKYRRTVKPTPINVQIVKEANSYDSWKERGSRLEKQAMADAINAFGKAVKRKDFEEMVDMFVSDREINGGEYLDAFRIVLKKYNLEDEFRKQLADLDLTKTPYEMNEDVSSPYIYQVGDLVQNVNPTCPHHGSKGIVMSVEPEELTYSVTNSGDTFKPGMRLTKTLDQLETM